MLAALLCALLLSACPCVACRSVLPTRWDAAHGPEAPLGMPGCTTIWVFGLGTGRSGSTSLWRLLRFQFGSTAVSHEARPLLPWTTHGEAPSVTARRRLELLATLAENRTAFTHPRTPADGRRFLGDVSSSYLPYAEALLEASPCAVLLVLQRDREEVVRSFAAKSGGADFWHDDVAATPRAGLAGAEVRGQEAFWGAVFPKYTRVQAATKQDAIRLYWEEYARRAAQLAAAHPQRVMVLQSPAVFQQPLEAWRMLRFAGFQKPRLRPDHPFNCLVACKHYGNGNQSGGRGDALRLTRHGGGAFLQPIRDRSRVRLKTQRAVNG